MNQVSNKQNGNLVYFYTPSAIFISHCLNAHLYQEAQECLPCTLQSWLRHISIDVFVLTELVLVTCDKRVDQTMVSQISYEWQYYENIYKNILPTKYIICKLVLISIGYILPPHLRERYKITYLSMLRVKECTQVGNSKNSSSKIQILQLSSYILSSLNFAWHFTKNDDVTRIVRRTEDCNVHNMTVLVATHSMYTYTVNIYETL